MAVSNDAIMDRMIAEIQKAKSTMNEQKEWKLHIAHIQLLSDLLLEEKAKSPNQVMTPLEKKPMQTVNEEHAKEPDSSIFDF